MSVPGKSGLILIVALAVIDALILVSGVKYAAAPIDPHAMVTSGALEQDTDASAPARREPLLSAAIHQINLFVKKPAEHPTGI